MIVSGADCTRIGGLLLGLGAALWIGRASAQQQQWPSASGTGGTLNGPVVQAPDAQGTKLAPPPALPGALPNGVVPQERSTADMQPTDALFDAISRGDIAAARDAINRGADLEARNILGLTPLEASVDLRRNDISFLLLSLRGTVRRPAAATAAAVPVPVQRETRKTRQAAHAATLAATPAPRTPAPPLAKQFAGDGGAPIPDSGFLGFDRGAQR
jgi:hypothetical protein